MNQLNTLGWTYRNQYNPTPNRMTIILKIILTRYRVNGDSPSLSQIFHHIVRNFHNFHNFHSPILLPILLFLDLPLKKNLSSKTIKAIQAMLESQQKKLNSPISQYFQDSYSFSPIQNDQPSTLKMSMECFCESELQSQNILDSQSSLSF